MSSGNMFERLSELWASICKLILDGKRAAEDVCSVLQAVVDGKRLIEAKPLALQEMLADWASFYKEVFGLDLDFSEVAIPEHKHGFDLLLVIAEGITPQRLFDKCKELFPSWKYTDSNLDEVIKSDRTSQDGHYAVWVRDRVEADEENRNLSADDLKKRGTAEITLEERMVYELKLFKKIGEHLDKSNWPFCAGSRYSGGSVPNAIWDDWFVVFWDFSNNRNDNLPSRSVVS